MIMTKRKDPRDRLVQPFSKADDQVFMDSYGAIPVKDLIPLMEYPHPLSSSWVLPKENHYGKNQRSDC